MANPNSVKKTSNMQKKNFRLHYFPDIPVDDPAVNPDCSATEKNSFKRNEEYGILVSAGSGNRFTRNTAKKNDDQDIWTDVPAGDNTWNRNRFKTGNAPD